MAKVNRRGGNKMPEKKRVSPASGLNRQSLLMLSIIFISFFGSKLLVWSFNTSTLRASVEAETHLAASLLANDINTNMPKDMIHTGVHSGNLLTELQISFI